MANLKHVGRLRTNKRRAVVAYRTLPNDHTNCLVIFTDTLPQDEHQALMSVVESAAGQQAYELAEVLSRNYLPDGRQMLAGFHLTGRLQKIATNTVEMTPNTNTSIPLDELNAIIAQQQGVSVEDLAIKPSNQAQQAAQPVTREPVRQDSNPYIEDVVTVNEQPLTDEQLAAKYRSDADRLYKEAKKLREMADELAPIKKKTATKTAESA